MKGALRKLYFVELRRQWTVAAAFIPLGVALLSALMAYTGTRFVKDYDVIRSAVSINMTWVIPVAVSLFAVAIVAADVKEGWLRTLLIRPVSRQQYLLIKMAAVYTSVLITIVIAGIVPNVIVAGFFVKGEVQFDLVRFLAVHGIFLLQALLILSILTFFSCWLPGAFNVVLLIFWAIFASAIGAFLRQMYWSNKWITILNDFIFPSGFSDSIDVILGGKGTPFAELAWGLGALGIFLALAFWSVSKIQVDKGSE
jgi:ABC-type transport system involved in multi-copper enzyme maturation permease subunit